jgi:NhaA family Na+:H+ antiporter
MGIHPTLAGVILGLLTPSTPYHKADFEDSDDGSVSVVEFLQVKLHSFSSLFVIPIFAIANTGVVLSQDSISQAMGSVIAWGIFAGLVLGKPLGIVLATYAAARLKAAEIPDGASAVKLIATGSAAGIGFTVSIFIADLAFEDPTRQNIAIIAVIFASIVSALLSALLFKVRLGRSTKN